MPQTIYLADALPGSGKTESFIRQLKQGDYARYVYAVPTKVLTNEIVKRIGDTYPTLVINSDTHGNVRQEVEQALRGKKPVVLLITHATLEVIEPGLLKDWIVVIDEAPTIPSCSSDLLGSIAYKELLERYLVSKDANTNEVAINPDLAAEAEGIYRDGRANAGIRAVSAYLGALLDGRSKVFVQETDNKKKGRPEHLIRTAAFKNYLPVYESAMEVHILGADIRRSLAVGHASHHGFRLSPSRFTPEHKRYDDYKTILPLIEGAHISKNMLLTRRDGTPADRWDNTVYGSSLLDSAVEFVAGRPAIATVMSWCDYKFPKNFQMLPFDSRGLNDYGDIHISVCLFHGNPEPIERQNHAIMANMMGMDPDEVHETIRYERFQGTILQSSTRTSLRAREIKGESFTIVPTEQSAKDLVVHQFTGNSLVDLHLVHSTPKSSKQHDRALLKEKALIEYRSGKSMQDIADMLDVNKSTVSRWLNQ